MSAYLRTAKVELEEAGESTEGMASSTSKLREKILSLTNQRVDIMSDSNTLKSTYQIYKELSQVFDSMTDIDQSALLELISGKRLGNYSAALLHNFDIAEKALKTSQNSAGSASEENRKYLESLGGRMTLLKASFEDLSQTILSSNIFKFLPLISSV